MTAKRGLYERDLWEPVRDFLVEQGYTVRSEAKYCDIAAVKDDELVVVELKLGLTVSLLTQAVQRQKLAETVYIAIPKPLKQSSSQRSELHHLIRRLELGLIVVSIKDGKASIEIPIHPVPFSRGQSRARSVKKRDALLREVSSRSADYNVGGSSGRKLMTAYREKAIFVACALAIHGQSSPSQLRALGSCPKATGNILFKNYYGWFDREGAGLYSLSEEGRKAIAEYSALSDSILARLVVERDAQNSESIIE